MCKYIYMYVYVNLCLHVYVYKYINICTIGRNRFRKNNCLAPRAVCGSVCHISLCQGGSFSKLDSDSAVGKPPA